VQRIVAKYFFLKAVLIIFCFAVVCAIFLQDFSGYIPSCVFNRGQAFYYSASSVCLALFLSIGFFTFFCGKKTLFIIVVYFLFVFAIEIAIHVCDYFIVNSPNIRVGTCWKYKDVMLWRPNQYNLMGFNEKHTYTKEISADKLRILFLGDSYTFSSGSSIERSYCKIVEKYFNAHSKKQCEVFNAGVQAYSPHDSLKLLRLLKQEGYRYDAVVFSIFLQNDFIDEVINTKRVVVGGFYQRFPENWFIHYFHPLNTLTFRYIIVLKALISETLNNKVPLLRTSLSPVQNKSDNDATYIVKPELKELLDKNYHTKVKRNFENVYKAITGMANESGVPFYIVIFPDPLWSDRRIQDYFLSQTRFENYDFMIYYNWINKNLQHNKMLDLTETLKKHNDCYIKNDTHLNDTGNRIAGEAVANFLLANISDFLKK